MDTIIDPTIPPAVHEHADPNHANAQAAMTAAASRIPGDTVNKATADLPDNQRSAIRRLHALYTEENLSLDELAKMVRLSTATISLVFRGKYNAKLDDICQVIDEFFILKERRAGSKKLPFIATSLSEKIGNVCAAANEFQKIAFIFGDYQIGKSEALLEYQRTHNHGNTIYVSMPTGGALCNLIVEMGEALRISATICEKVLRRRIMSAIDDRMLLIIDEAHRAIPDSSNARGTSKIQSIEFIREIYDKCRCGVVICATNVFRDEMDHGAMSKLLGQSKRRRLCALQLPNRVPREDLDRFAAAYGLPPSAGKYRDLEKRIIEDEALGFWLTLLRMAGKIAGQRKQKLTWDHVSEAHAGLLDLETMGDKR
jgi:transcriptional regulator with XRE-family HTH domain